MRNLIDIRDLSTVEIDEGVQTQENSTFGVQYR